MDDKTKARVMRVAHQHLAKLTAGDEVVAQDIRLLCYEEGIEVENEREFGPIMKTLKKEGRIAASGVTTRGRSHGGFATRWIKLGRM